MTNIALIIAVLCTLLLVARFVRQTAGFNARAWVSWAATVVGAAGAFFAFNSEFLGPWRAPVAGLLSGLAAAMALMDFSDSDEPSALGAPFGLAAISLGVFAAEAKGNPLFALAFVVGAAAAAGVLAIQQRSRASGVLTTLLLVGFASIVLGATISPTEGVQTVVNVLTAALLALLLGEGVTLALKKAEGKWPPLGTALVFAGLTYLLTVRTGEVPDLPLVAAGSALVAVLLSFSTRGIKDSIVAALVGSLVWLGVATAAFSFAKGYGLALAALVGICSTLLLGDRRGVAWCAPMIAMAVYRFARLEFPDVTRAFDIGQHYAIVGLLLGLLLPLIVVEWGRSMANGKTWATTLAATLAGVALLTGTSLAVAFLGAKGASGLIIGFIASSALSGIKGESAKTAMSISLGLGTWTVVSIGALTAQQEMARPEKVKFVLSVGAVVLILSVAAWGLTRLKKESLA